MKSTGIVRRLDELGRIVLPIELRRTLSLAEKDTVEIFVEGGDIILRKYQPGCSFCGESKKLIEFKGRQICQRCARAVAEKL
ncbi:MAG: AbrB/MazE/SpoVT family DNA-binding domain-containing protein [Butyricicoccus sp.]|nr:AbrB/MazE/SpoVT family DNA-binding domain-containing protein [Butyricicoccus sp.]